MTLWVYLSIVLCALLPAVARFIPTGVTPAVAARALAAAAAVAATASTSCLLLLALTLFDDLPPLATLDRQPELGLPKPVPGPVALLAALLAAWGFARVVRSLRDRRRILTELRGAGAPTDGLVVADWQRPYAIAVPGRPGHVLVTSGMLRLLDDRERRVLFAHERSHLRRRHDRLIAVVTYAAALNPLLKPLTTIESHLVERWADEDAATAVGGDRGLVARAVAKASLATAEASPSPVLGLHGSAALQRINALVDPTPPRGFRKLTGIVALCAVLALTTAAAVLEFVEVAHAWLTYAP